MAAPLPTTSDMDALLAFRTQFAAEGFTAIQKWIPTSADKHACVFPSALPEYVDAVEEFYRLASAEHWSDRNYCPEETGAMLEDRDLVGCASLLQVRTMLTYCVRGERFSDGHWGTMIDHGHVPRLLDRLSQLRVKTQSGPVATMKKTTFDFTTLRGTIEAAKVVAARYRVLTGKPLGITGEIGEVVAASLMDLELAEARQAGYDAIGQDRRKVQIKARCILPDSKPGQRVGGIRLEHEWDTVVLVLLDQDFEPTELFEAPRELISIELRLPGSKSRNERGALSVSKFKSIAHLVWSRDESALSNPVMQRIGLRPTADHPNR
jgi:hypothetical protein